MTDRYCKSKIIKKRLLQPRDNLHLDVLNAIWPLRGLKTLRPSKQKKKKKNLSHKSLKMTNHNCNKRNRKPRDRGFSIASRLRHGITTIPSGMIQKERGKKKKKKVLLKKFFLLKLFLVHPASYTVQLWYSCTMTPSLSTISLV